MTCSPRRVVWLAAFALAAASCGGGGSSAPSSPSSPTSPTSPTSPPTPTTPASSACSVAGGFLAQGIVNGTECAAGNSPVVKLNLTAKDGGGYCSGTIIAPRAVLTAAHCLDGDVTSVKIYQGSGDQITASSFSYHPTYHETAGGGSTGLDIGVVLTAQDFARTPVPLLSSRDPRIGEQAVIAGWGQDVTGAGGNTLRAGSVTISSVSASLLQTQNSSTASAVCSGDSGGPILLSEGGTWVLGGVTSATSIGGSCALGTSYYTNILHPDVMRFITGLVPGITQK